jgi:hypothetical protein
MAACCLLTYNYVDMLHTVEPGYDDIGLYHTSSYRQIFCGTS